MINNRIQFAVVREDPSIEENIIRQFGYNKILLIGSGGCTAFHLKRIFNTINIDVLDANLAQIDLIKEKIDLLNNNQGNSSFNIETADPLGLNACGNFESLFSMWRLFVNEFVSTEQDLKDIIFHNKSAQFIFENPYWKTSFDLFFSDSMLITLFTEKAIQHATKGSYPYYFREILETGLLRPDRSTNYFLHHIIFGHYFSNALPIYLEKNPNAPIAIDHFYLTTAKEFNAYKDYDLISFSNLFDWMEPDESAEIIDRIASALKPNSGFLLRQLNNIQTYNFGNSFKEYTINLQSDRSMFYNKISLYRKEA